MKKATALIIILLIILGGIITYINYPKEHILGASCGTVSPDSRDACCYRKFKDDGFPKCLGAFIFYNLETQKCKFKCGISQEIYCTEDAMACGDGTWTSRTSVLNCSFIPCGYN